MKFFIRLTVGYLVMSIGLSTLLGPNLASAQQEVLPARYYSMWNASKESQNMAVKSALGNEGAGKSFGEKCGGWNATFCVMSTLSYAQAGLAIVDYFKSKKIKEQAACTGSTLCSGSRQGFDVGVDGDTTTPTFDTSSTGDTTFGDTTSSPEDRRTAAMMERLRGKIQKEKKALAEKGYAFNEKTGGVDTPKGSIPASSLSSPEAMIAAGFPPGEVAEAMAMYKKIASSLPKIDGGYAGGGGAIGAKVAARESGSSGFDMNAYMRGLQGARKPASLDGLKKYVGSEPIGVSVDNIFDMVSRRYKSEADQGKFLP